MILFLKGILIGIGKIIPGISGAMLAINFNIYEKSIDAITNFFSSPKNNAKFLLILGISIISSIILFSKIIYFLINNYPFLTLMFFIGLILGGTYNFSRKITYNKKSIVVIILVIIFFLLISYNKIYNVYKLNNNFYDDIIFFIGGYIDMLATIVPGLSGTSLLMIIGIYNEVIKLIANIYNFEYLIGNINLYLSYGIGMFLSFLLNIKITNYLLKKHKNNFYIIILGLSISSILFLVIKTLNNKYTIVEFIFGLMLLIIGLLISSITDK